MYVLQISSHKNSVLLNLKFPLYQSACAFYLIPPEHFDKWRVLMAVVVRIVASFLFPVTLDVFD